MKEIISPCISVCEIDPMSGYCSGCWRTRSEIVGWKKLLNDEKLQLLKSLHERRADSGIDMPRRARRTSRRRFGEAQ